MNKPESLSKQSPAIGPEFRECCFYNRNTALPFRRQRKVHLTLIRFSHQSGNQLLVLYRADYLGSIEADSPSASAISLEVSLGVLSKVHNSIPSFNDKSNSCMNFTSNSAIAR